MKHLQTIYGLPKFAFLPKVDSLWPRKDLGRLLRKNKSPQFADSGFPLEGCELNKMAAHSSRTDVKEASKEVAFEAFRAKFTRNG